MADRSALKLSQPVRLFTRPPSSATQQIRRCATCTRMRLQATTAPRCAAAAHRASKRLLQVAASAAVPANARTLLTPWRGPSPPSLQQPIHVQHNAAIKFTKHLSTVSNGCAPPLSRFESLGWLLFETKRQQAALLGPHTATAHTWLSIEGGLQLLEQIYLVGAAIADLGTADGLQPLSSSNGSRAIVSLDYSRLLERYLQQHGQLLTEAFWSQLQPHDDLQARAIHVATCLETRCTVHALLFDKLIERVGTESSAGGAWGSSSSLHGYPGGPLATAITNTMINTTQQHSAPVTSQCTLAAPSAVNSNNAASSSTTNAAAPAPSTVHGIWGWLGNVGAVVLLVCSVAGRVVQVVIAVVAFGRDLLMQLLMLRAVSAGAKAVAAKASTGPQLQQPAFAVVGGTALPAAAGSGYQMQQQLLPGSNAPSHRPAAQPAVAAAGSLGLLSTVPLVQQQRQQQKRLQQQQQQQHALEAGGQSWVVVQGSPTATVGALQTPQHSMQQGAAESVLSAAAAAPQRLLRGGLQRGLGSAQWLLRTAASASAASAAITTLAVLQHQRQQQGSMQQRELKAGSREKPGLWSRSLWSPADAGLQDLKGRTATAAEAGQFVDAGWGLSTVPGLSAAGCAAEEGGW